MMPAFNEADAGRDIGGEGHLVRDQHRHAFGASAPVTPWQQRTHKNS
jgi:hypothetical protein